MKNCTQILIPAILIPLTYHDIKPKDASISSHHALAHGSKGVHKIRLGLPHTARSGLCAASSNSFSWLRRWPKLRVLLERRKARLDIPGVPLAQQRLDNRASCKQQGAHKQLSFRSCPPATPQYTQQDELREPQGLAQGGVLVPSPLPDAPHGAIFRDHHVNGPEDSALLSHAPKTKAGLWSASPLRNRPPSRV